MKWLKIVITRTLWKKGRLIGKWREVGSRLWKLLGQTILWIHWTSENVINTWVIDIQLWRELKRGSFAARNETTIDVILHVFTTVCLFTIFLTILNGTVHSPEAYSSIVWDKKGWRWRCWLHLHCRCVVFLPFYSCSSVNRDESMVVVTLSSGSIRFLTTTDFNVIHSIETGHTNILCTRFIQCAASIVVICYQSLLVTFFYI